MGIGCMPVTVTVIVVIHIRDQPLRELEQGDPWPGSAFHQGQQPIIETCPVGHHQLGPGHQTRLPGRGFPGMGIRPQGYQRTYGHRLSPHLLHEILQDGKGGHHLHGPGREERSAPPKQSPDQNSQQHAADVSLHTITHLSKTRAAYLGGLLCSTTPSACSQQLPKAAGSRQDWPAASSETEP